ncbi:hypothetical protein SEVIR_3G115951v4 [Setaria viridis]
MADTILVQDVAPPQAPTTVGPLRVEQIVRASHRGEKKKKSGEDSRSVVMCTNLVARSGDKSKTEWVPPKVTHDFSYPSDEEIKPNPKANFKKAFMPRLGHMRSSFKGAEEIEDSGVAKTQDEARTSAPCLPITVGKGSLSDGDKVLALDTSPRCYIDITSRFPQDPEDL